MAVSGISSSDFFNYGTDNGQSIVKQLQQDIQSQTGKMQGHHHHHHGGGNGSDSIGQTFSQLGQALQSGDLSSAQSIFATLQQELQQLTMSSGQSSIQTGSTGTSSTQAGLTGISINA